MLAYLLLALTINDAERDAVTTVAAALADGPAAVYARLSPDAPLRALPREDAIAEIAVRMGPRDGARWTLQTVSGGRPGDVAFRVTFPSGYEDGLLFRMKGRAVHEVLTLAEDPMYRAPPPAPVPPPRKKNTALITFAILLAIISAAVFRKSRVLAFIGFAIALAAIWSDGLSARRNPRRAKSPSFQELRSLQPLREALARGDEPRIAPNSDVATLWILQSGATTRVPGTASDPLGGLKTVTHTPLAELLRARLAINKGDTATATAAYQRALAIEPRRDDIAFEAMPLVEDLRFDDSRDPRLHYARALRSGSADALRTAWSLAPVTREELVREPRILPLLRDARMMAMVSFYAAEEPAPRSASLGTSPLTLPNNARALATGGFLAIEIGNATIEIPGGAALAPPNVRLVPATHWKRKEDVDLVKLTDHVTAQTALVAPRLFLLRMRALLRADRAAEARALAESAKVKDPSTIRAIADAIANDRASWDTAEKLYRSINAEDRLRQLALRRTLAANGTSIVTQHFDIRHDPTMNPAIAARIGDLLEAELARVQKKLPNATPRRVTVNVLFWDAFREGIPGGDHILGMYDGEIILPFARVNQFKPELVAIITHELTHAVIAQATSDRAPRWFQEGVAQRMELVPHQENAFHETNPELVLPLSLLDAVMENTADLELTKDAYEVSQTFIRFLEHRYGSDALAKLIASFAAGKTSDEAITALTGKSLDALTREFRAWGFANSANFTNDEPFPYRDLYSPGVDPRIKAGFQWSKRPR